MHSSNTENELDGEIFCVQERTTVYCELLIYCIEACCVCERTTQAHKTESIFRRAEKRFTSDRRIDGMA